MTTTPVLMPGESHGQRSLVGYSPLGHKESDITEYARMCHVCKTHCTGCFSLLFVWSKHFLLTK